MTETSSKFQNVELQTYGDILLKKREPCDNVFLKKGQEVWKSTAVHTHKNTHQSKYNTEKKNIACEIVFLDCRWIRMAKTF